MTTKNKPEPEIIGYDENGPCYAPTTGEKVLVYGAMVAGCAAWGLIAYLTWEWIWG